MSKNLPKLRYWAWGPIIFSSVKWCWAIKVWRLTLHWEAPING